MLKKELSQLMDLENLSLNENAKVQNLNAKDIFCQYWDNARKVIEAMKAIIKNPIVKIILVTILTLGDSLQSKFCKPE